MLYGLCLTGRRETYGSVFAKIDIHPRLDLQLVDELRIHTRAGRCESLQSARGLTAAIHQHAARSMRRFPAGLATLDHENACPLLTKFNR